MSGKRSRDKGVKGEREVGKAFEIGGFPVRGLEGQGDHLIVTGSDVTLHIEVKRAETLRLPLWTRQAENEAPQGTVPIVCYRSNREPWRASLKLDDLIALLVLLTDAKRVKTIAELEAQLASRKIEVDP
jgi:hypothetical protein